MDQSLLTGDLTQSIIVSGQVLAIVVTLATVVTALTPTKADNRILDKLLTFLNLMAGNVGLNRNADDK